MSKVSGSYKISTNLVNGRNQWKKTDKSQILWFDKEKDRWVISSSIGTEGSIFAASIYVCPSRVNSDWQYYDDSHTFKNAESKITVKCSGLLKEGF